MKKFFLFVFIAFITSNNAFAVLDEKNLGSTLAVLRQELEMNHNDTRRSMIMSKELRENMQSRVMQIMSESNQIALMLYSQKMDYIFDLTYACDKATTLYNDFSTIKMPFDKVLTNMEVEEARYEGLIDNLESMPKEMLTERERMDRDVCLTLCTAMKRSLNDQSQDLREYKRIYETVGQRLKELNDYAIKRYDNIRQSIFINGGETYLTVLSDLGGSYQRAMFGLQEKYSSGNSKVESQWRGPVVIGWFVFMIFYGLVAVVLNLLFIRFLLPAKFKTAEFLEKRTCIVLASTVITFAIVIMVLGLFVLRHNFFVMACKLLMQYMWLLAVILLSMLVRLNGKQVNSGLRIYAPIMLTGFIVITFRIILIPNELVNLVFPAIMLATTLWQLLVLIRYQKNMPRSDTFYSSISLVIMIASVITSWLGYTLLSVQLLIWWIMQFTCIQTITCLYDILTQYERVHFKRGEVDIRKTWFYDFIRKALVPILMASSLFLSFYMATEVFSLTELCRVLFLSNFIDIANVAKVSLLKLLIVFSLFFVVKYAVYVFRAFFLLYYGGKQNAVMGEKALMMKAGAFVLWFVFVMVSMLVLNINSSGILVAMGGLSTGIGFAMKDTIENLFYGVSLMTGRLHIGDVIECDGVRGRVVDISYQSTMIEAVDGSVIAILNNQLFTKNFKNMTRNHHNETVRVSVGVAYGTDVEHARKVMLQAVEKLNCFDKKSGAKVVVEELGDNSVNLGIILRVPVETKIYAISEVYEAVYNALNSAGISIPFPQRDLHIVDMPVPIMEKLTGHAKNGNVDKDE